MFAFICIASLGMIVFGAMIFTFAGIWESVIWSAIFSNMEKVRAGDLDEIALHEHRLRKANIWRLTKYASVALITVGFCILWMMICLNIAQYPTGTSSSPTISVVGFLYKKPPT